MSAGQRFAALYRRLVPIALLLTLIVVVMGAWVRLTDAGLGCPDWPGCYGQLVVPADAGAIAAAEAEFPERPLDEGKAWREMIHRYAASTLGLLILLIAAGAVANRDDPDQPVAIPLLLVATVIGQGILGMLTVTWLLKPVIVLAHLLGGLTTLGLVSWLWFSIRRPKKRTRRDSGRTVALVTLGLVVVLAQIALGGWTSANYAAMACPDFPTCQARWWPDMDMGEAFVLWRGLGIDYEGGVLEHPARTAIHMMHRIGAVTVLILFAFILARVARAAGPPVRRAGHFVLVALALQIALGVTIVMTSLPLSLATAHNGGAALLLMATLYLLHTLTHARE